MKSLITPLLLSVAMIAGPCLAQENSGKKAAKAPPVSALSENKHYSIAYLAPSPTGKAEDVSKGQNNVLQSIGDGLAKKLSTQGLVRVPALDVQCCTVQFTLLNSGPGVNVRVSLIDIDMQQLYTKEFRSDAKSNSGAVDEVIGMVMADQKIMSSLRTAN